MWNAGMNRNHARASLLAIVLAATRGLVACSGTSAEPPVGTTDAGPDAQGVSADSSAEGGTEGDATLAGDTAQSDALSETGALEGQAEAHAEADGSGVVVEAGPDVLTSDVATVDSSDGGVDGEPGDATGAGADAKPGDAAGDGSSAETGPVDGSSDALATYGADASDAAADAGPEAGTSTASIILATQGADCEACALTYCAGATTNCESLGAAVATDGPAAGTSRTTLCYETLACVLDTTLANPCYDEGLVPEVCYCGPTETSTQCVSGPGSDSQCAVQEERGLESSDPATVYTRLESTDVTLGAEVANAIFECLSVSCPNYCLF